MQKSIKDCAKRNDLRSMRLLAKEIVASRRTVARLLPEQGADELGEHDAHRAARRRCGASGHLEKSTEVLSAMNSIVKNEQVRDTMREMSKEMMKSGLIEELVNDALEDINGVDDLEAETDAEVNKILAELAGETDGGHAGRGTRARRSRGGGGGGAKTGGGCRDRRAGEARRPSTICRRDWTPYARWRKPAENVLIKTSPSSRTNPPISCTSFTRTHLPLRSTPSRVDANAGDASPPHLSAPEARRWPPRLSRPRRAPSARPTSRARSSAADVSFL